jgi:ribose-phosphate pyrophosphokinase
MILDLNNKAYSGISYDHFFFGGGEQQFRLTDPSQLIQGAVIIVLRFTQDSEIVKLMLAVDAIRRAKAETKISLVIPYFPGARQDRVCNTGEPLTVRVYADIINSLKFESVTILDPHSDVTPALIDNVVVRNNFEFVCASILEIIAREGAKQKHLFTLVSPDAGANKKVYNVSKHLINRGLNIESVIRADKLRDLSTGKIIETTVYADDLTDKVCVIIDDICSYGGTFCALATKLKEKNAAAVYLVVTHNEGVADNHKLKASGIDWVYTTNSKGVIIDETMTTIIPIQQAVQ